MLTVLRPYRQTSYPEAAYLSIRSGVPWIRNTSS